ncbi:MAG: hypothetical protein K0Q95_3326 [Bacteroidota bacterium]|jgi:hypothetical protein|nr:hypothetical protein [Bacteroidota bacterium]
MYSRNEAAQLKQEFWIAFGKYMSLHPGSEGLRINWINYHTGYKHVYFRMHADQKKALISIQLTHPDPLWRELYYDRFSDFKTIIHEGLDEEWVWEKEYTDEHRKLISRIYKEISNVNLYNKDTWPEIISFLKPRIIALDEIWNIIKDAFEELR